MKQRSIFLLMLFIVVAFELYGCSKRESEMGLVATIETEFKKNAFSVGPYVVAAQDMPFTNAIPMYFQAFEANKKCLELVHFFSVVKAVESDSFADVSTNAVELILADPGNVEYASVQFLCLKKSGNEAEAQDLAEKVNGQNKLTDYEKEIWSIASISNYTSSVTSRFTKRQLEYIHLLIRYKNSHHVVSDP